jgi:NhaP-type Na+/H+ or K+/H+ antiporter
MIVIDADGYKLIYHHDGIHIGASPKLTILIVGESLLNDGSAMVSEQLLAPL